MAVAGLLLAAGRGRRFDPEGRQSKLEALVDGRPVAVQALGSLAAGCDLVLAVCRPEQVVLIAALEQAGARVHLLDPPLLARTGEGMGVSLAAGARALMALGHDGGLDLQRPVAAVLVMPADMPWVLPETVRQIAAVATPADIVVPVLTSGATAGTSQAVEPGEAAPPVEAGNTARQREAMEATAHDVDQGHPVRFAAGLLPELAALGADRGARPLFARHRVHYLPVADPGIVRDVDRPADLRGSARAADEI